LPSSPVGAIVQGHLKQIIPYYEAKARPPG